jgi:hypothetical protein
MGHCFAGDGAQLIQANALDKLRHHLFGQAGVGADSADGGALLERLYGLAKLVGRNLALLGMGRQHLGDPVVGLGSRLVHHGLL